MSRLLCLLLLLWVSLPAPAQPGILLLFDSGKPAHLKTTVATKKFLQLLLQANGLTPKQLPVSSIDFARRDQASRWQSQFGVTPQALPALALMRGQKVEALQVRYGDPQKASELVFRNLQAAYPELVTQVQIVTSLTLTSLPDGATVLVNGEEKGKTPCKLTLQPKAYQLELKHPDCLPHRQNVTPRLGENREVYVTLTLQKAFLRFESAVSPAELSLDGGAPKVLPALAEIEAGPHTYKVTSPGHYPVEGELQVTAEQMTTVQVKPLPIQLRVGLDQFEARGYEGFTTSGVFNTYIETYYVGLNEAELLTALREALAKSSLFNLESSDANVLLKVQVQSSKQEVVGVVTVVDAQGQTLEQFTAQKDMPFLTFDEEGSAQHRAREVMDEITKFLLEALPKHSKLSVSAPSDAPSQIEVQVGTPPE